jgi:uncharacterized RDD family membrane protein YckC
MQAGGPGVTDWSRPPPPGPAPGIAYAGFWIRTIAFVVDLVLVLIVASIVGAGIGLVGLTVVGEAVALSIAAALAALASIVYFVGGWVGWGRTAGMAVTDLHLVRAADGGPVFLGRAMLRYATLPLSFLILFLGVLFVAFDPQKQGWHDRIAGTFVVRPVRG